ncbi:hypothetical protein KCV06_g297, partial [Aureobasidium melanogenum]
LQRSTASSGVNCWCQFLMKHILEFINQAFTTYAQSIFLVLYCIPQSLSLLDGCNLFTLIFSSYVSPFLLVCWRINGVGSQLRNLLVLDLFGQDQVENQRDEGANGEALLHNQYNGIEEAFQSLVATVVCEDIAEPTADL